MSSEESPHFRFRLAGAKPKESETWLHYRENSTGFQPAIRLLIVFVVAELRSEQIGQGPSRTLDRVGALIEPVEIALQVVSVGVAGNRQGQEGLGLEPLAELLGQAGHLRRVAARLMPRVELLVSCDEPVDFGFFAAELSGAVRLAVLRRELSRAGQER